MLNLVTISRPAAATEAEAIVRAFRERGIGLFIVVEPDGDARVAIEPWVALQRNSGVQAVRDLVPLNRRFLTDPRFARDLFGHLDVEGRVYAPRPARGFHIDFDKRGAS